MQEWRVYGKKADFSAIGSRFGIDPVVARVIRNRGLENEADINRYLNGSLADLYDPRRMKNLPEAVSLLCLAIAEHRSIRIIGDYDIDGICSIYILFQGLLRAGADVDYDVPHRITDGYGLNEKLVSEAHQDGREVIITCDNGIAAQEAIDLGKSLGMTMIVTDHHEVPFVQEGEIRNYSLPPADCVVDPKQPEETYPFGELCGAGVAYKLISLLYDELDIPKQESEKFLEFAAIATIGDIVNLSDENRILVKEGLKRLHVTKNTGLNALFEELKIEKTKVSPHAIGFVIGPCFNASGRLDSAKRAIELLCTKDYSFARKAAAELVEMNMERRRLTDIAVEEGIAYATQHFSESDRVLVIYLENCHESIAGLVAGKIREKFYRPTIVLTKAEDGAKGSARSIEAYNIFEKLTECKDLLTRFGGHPMAAGMSLPIENIDILRKRLNERAGLSESDLIEKVWIDVPMPIDYLSEKLIEDLDRLLPFGKGNEKPVFADKNLIIASIRTIGRNNEYTKMTLMRENGNMIDAVAFFEAGELIEAKQQQRMIDCTYYPAINEFGGKKNLQISVIGYKIHT